MALQLESVNPLESQKLFQRVFQVKNIFMLVLRHCVSFSHSSPQSVRQNFPEATWCLIVLSLCWIMAYVLRYSFFFLFLSLSLLFLISSALIFNLANTNGCKAQKQKLWGILYWFKKCGSWEPNVRTTITVDKNICTQCSAGIKLWPCHLLFIWLWASYLTHLNLSFPMCNIINLIAFLWRQNKIMHVQYFTPGLTRKSQNSAQK